MRDILHIRHVDDRQVHRHAANNRRKLAAHNHAARDY